MCRTTWFLIIFGVAVASFGCSDPAGETCVEQGMLVRLSPAPLTVANELQRSACFVGLDEVNGCPVYGFRVLPTRGDRIEGETAELIQVSCGGDPSECTDSFVAGLTLDGHREELEATRMGVTEGGAFAAEGIHEYASGAMGSFMIVLHPDLGLRLVDDERCRLPP